MIPSQEGSFLSGEWKHGQQIAAVGVARPTSPKLGFRHAAVEECLPSVIWIVRFGDREILVLRT